MYLLRKADSDRYTDEWRIDRDGSIKPSPDYPNSSPFELISPILRGEKGRAECQKVLDVLNDVTAQLLNWFLVLCGVFGVFSFGVCLAS
jgi:hypothetical protein